MNEIDAERNEWFDDVMREQFPDRYGDEALQRALILGYDQGYSDGWVSGMDDAN